MKKKNEELVVLKKAVGYWKEKAKNKTLGKGQTDQNWMTMEELQAAEEEKNKDNSDYEPEKLSPRSGGKRKRQADSDSKEEEDIVELRQSVKHWKKKAESRSNKIDEQVEQQRLEAEQEEAGGELEEEQGEQKGDGSRKLRGEEERK